MLIFKWIIEAILYIIFANLISCHINLILNPYCIMCSQLKVGGSNQWRSKPGCLRLHISIVIARPLKHMWDGNLACLANIIVWSMEPHTQPAICLQTYTQHQDPLTKAGWTDNKTRLDAGSQQYDVVAAPSHPSFSSSFYLCSSNYGRSWAGRLHHAQRGGLHHSPLGLASSSSCCLCPSA